MFERMFGPITIHERLDVLFARSDANSQRIAAGKKARSVKTSDYLVKWFDPPKKIQPWEKIKSKWRDIVKAFD